MKTTRIVYILSLLFIFNSCDEKEIKSGETGKITIEFDNHVGENDLELNTPYQNSSGETFSLTKLSYYISNIRLRTVQGTEYIVPQDSSYFLINEDDPESQEVTISNIPAGDYNQITFIIGVDSVRSKMDVSMRTGVLDPGDNEMYVDLNSGYIFLMMEGESPESPLSGNAFNFSIGGYGGYDTPGINNIRERTVDMGNAHADIREDKSPEVHLHVDVLEIFSDPETISIAEHPEVTISEFSKTVSANYIDMFSYDHVHN
jgi:hypothetical protein